MMSKSQYMEDYEAKYKNAVNKITEFIDGYQRRDITKDFLIDLFPEISERLNDEFNKKWILEYLYDGLQKSDEQFKDQFKAAIDWLEKQNSKLNLDELCDWLRKNVSNYTNGEYNEFHHQYEYNGTIDIDGLIKKLKSDFS